MEQVNQATKLIAESINTMKDLAAGKPVTYPDLIEAISNLEESLVKLTTV